MDVNAEKAAKTIKGARQVLDLISDRVRRALKNGHALGLVEHITALMEIKRVADGQLLRIAAEFTPHADALEADALEAENQAEIRAL